jgi:hypothetical protein
MNHNKKHLSQIETLIEHVIICVMFFLHILVNFLFSPPFCVMFFYTF